METNLKGLSELSEPTKLLDGGPKVVLFDEIALRNILIQSLPNAASGGSQTRQPPGKALPVHRPARGGLRRRRGGDRPAANADGGVHFRFCPFFL